MKSKNKKIQNILMKGITIGLVTLFTATPMVFAASSSLDDSNISLWDKLIYGTVGSTAKEIEEYFEKCPVIYISNEIQLRALAEYVNNGHDCSGKVIYLANNIEVSQEEWVPIGTNKHPFKGTFDGQNYTISKINFNRNNKLNSKLSNVGIIGYVASIGIVKNLKLENSKFDIPYEIASDIIYKSDDLVTESTNGTFMTEIVNVGGIVGHNEGIIENCEVSSNVTINGVANAGGIAGENYKGKVEGCINNGKINGFQNVGGIVGLTSGQRDDLKDNNKLDFSKNTVGKIINCKNGNNAVVYSVIGSSGGITGALKWNGIIQKCINEGQIHITTETITLNTVGTKVKYDPQNVGGIVGYASGSINPDNNQKMYVAIDGCINSSDARVKGNQDVGGIAGQLGGQGGGYAILSNSVNYSTNIVATNTTTGLGEAGYLIGEGGSRGWKTEPDQTYDDSIAILYNNLYFIPTIEDVGAIIDNKHQTTGGKIAAYGRFVNQRNTDTEKDPNPYYYDTNTNVFLQRDNKYQIYKVNKIEGTDGNISGGMAAGYSNIDVNNMYPIYTNSNATAKTSGINYGGNINVKVEDGLLYDYNNTTGELTIKSAANSQLIDSSSNTTVSYTISKKAKGESNYTEVKGNAYFKTDDEIKIEVKFNNFLTTSWGSSYEPINPKLTLYGIKENEKIEIESGNTTGSNKTNGSKITYTYTVKTGDDINISKIKLSQSGTVYAIVEDTHDTVRGMSNIEIIDSNIHIDTVSPIINTKVYVENALETGRYTTGKEVLIEVKTNEAIQVADGKIILPEIQVGFSKSGTGKYNYDEKNNKVGYAKPKSANIGADGIVTWLYSYQIQEGDEGDIQLEYKAGKITDLAGNETDIKELYTPQALAGSPVSGNSWNNELSVTYEFYKNSVSEENKVTANTYFTKDDDLIAVATFNKVLYVHYGLSDGKNTNVRLTNIHKDRVPSLYLNGDSRLKNTSASISTKNDSTIINYTFDMKSYDINALTNIEKVILKNENNTEVVSTSGTTAATNGLIPFAEEWYATYKSEDESKYKTVLNNAINTTNDIIHIILDPIGVSNNIEQSDIYADTTAPTVEIVAQEVENNITNADEIIYTFTWSEELAKEEGRTFEASDITVNNGTKGELVQDKNNSKVYTMVVTPNVASGNVGNLQVVVEKGACQDLVGHENVRTEKIITVDKKAPKLENYTITQSENGKQIIVEAIYNEAILDAGVSELDIQIGGRNAAGTQEKPEILESNNKVKYVYNISGADGGKVEITLRGTVKDIAGNHSEELKANIENDIVLEKTIIKTEDAEYSFRKNTVDITDFANPTYFKENDTIRVTKTVEETTEEGKTVITKNVYSYQIVPTYADNTHMKYMTLTEPEEGKTIGKATFGTNKVTGSIDITDANIYFDTTMPEIKTQVVAKNPKDGLYKAEEELIITATTSEKINEDFIPEINVKFANKVGEFNKGKAQNIDAKTNDEGITTWTYRYVVSEGDEGKISLSYTNDTITDLAGNKTELDRLNTKEGIFELNNITVDATAPTVQITAKKLDETKVTDVNGNITNADIIRYTFIWSEQVEGFTADDITVNNGTTGALTGPTKNADGTYTYTMDITTNVEKGNVGDIQVIVEKGACRDLVGHENVRTESVIRVDKQAPILISLEAYGTSDITVDQNVDSVKQYYKVGDTVTIVATFTENIGEKTTTVPTLALQFSESGNAKGQVSTGKIEGNQITYTYKIVDGDMGTLSVKGFTGKVIDAAGNETVVTKRNLDGDTIIADTVAPKLVGITAIAPDFEYDELLTNPADTKRYGVASKTRNKNTITIIAEYSENVYKLDGTVIKKLENKIGNGNVPNLGLKFGNVNATGTIKVKEVKENKIIYEYDIHENDNGDFSIVSIGGKVSDIAGNESNINQLPEKDKIVYYEKEVKEENKVDKITADTRKPVFTISTLPQMATDKDDNGNTITGNNLSNQYYYRKGSIITITATADEYIYKNNSNDLTKFTKDNMPAISLKFGDLAAKGKFTEKDVRYEAGKTIFTYKYEIAEGDNGKLSTSIAGDIGYDIALNGNNSNINAVSTSINADTVNPVTNWQSWVESEQYGIEDLGNGTWKVTFSEGLYTYNPDTHTVGGSVNTSSAPILLVSKDNVTPLETRVSSVTTTNGKTVITYTYSPYTKNIGAYGMKFANVSDKAGNLFNYKDQQAPTLVGNKLEVTSPATGTYKAGTQITIVATFSEKITGTAPTLKLKFGENAAKGTVSGGRIGEDGKTITYKYTITAGDNGLLSLESYTGTGLKDLSDNPWVAPENVTLSGNTITADTIAPTVVITSNVEKTNQDKVTYTFTWSEDVVGFTADDIEVINGLKGTFTKVNNKVYTLEVDTTNEGRQIVKVNANVCTDVAGNPNAERTTYNKVVIDYTKPEIRAKVNGGNYVIDTDSKKSILKETIVVNEEVSKFEYIWTKDRAIPTTGFTAINPDTIQVNSDIHLETQVVETGTYYLYVKVTDKAGNVFTGRTNAFVVSNAQITLTPNTTEKTNQDVTVTINYGNGLTENRRAGVQGKTQSADATKVIAVENGTVYAEATDKAGNKVYATLEITNIDKTKPTEPDTPPVEEDKTAPEITFNYTTTTATVGTAIGATITTNEDAIISYYWAGENWVEREISSDDYVRSINVKRTPTSAGTYTLYAKATDKASNTSKVSTLQFTVVKSDDDIVKPEVIFEDLTTIQKDGVKYVKVSPNYTTAMLTAKMNKDALLGKTPEYKNLTASKGLKTGSEITIDGSTKYIIIVNGDVNCDGKVDFLGDIVMINNYRIGVNQNLREIQILAGDINNSGSIDFIPDIVAMNNYRLGRINVL